MFMVAPRTAKKWAVTGEPLRRYEHDHPGSLIHVDATKFANIPAGGGHKFLSRAQSTRNARQTAHRTGDRGDRAKNWRPRIEIAFIHNVIDDHSRMAYAEIHSDEKAVTAIAVLERAVAWFAEHGVTVERVLSDDGPAYRSYDWRDASTELHITHKCIRQDGNKGGASRFRSCGAPSALFCVCGQVLGVDALGGEDCEVGSLGVKAGAVFADVCGRA
jgi:hypothetical protein